MNSNKKNKLDAVRNLIKEKQKIEENKIKEAFFNCLSDEQLRFLIIKENLDKFNILLKNEKFQTIYELRDLVYKLMEGKLN